MHNRGFTLIELLLVIAIIGVLASIVLASINQARIKGADAKVIAQVKGAKNAAEIYQDGAGGYGPANLSQATAGTSCAGAMYADVPSGMAQYANSASYPGGTNLVCIQNVTNFAFAGSLSTGVYRCVDAIGTPMDVAFDPATIASSDDTCAKLDLK